jgi:hypothetical protein
MSAPLGNAGIPALAQAFKSALFAGGSDKVLSFLGDSTGNATDEHFYLLTTAMEAADATHYIDYYLYDDTTKAHILNALLGRQSTFSLMQETFTRADGAVGTTSSGGQTWAANSWTISSNKAVPNATSSFLTASSTLSSTSAKVKVDVTYSATGDYRVYLFDQSSINIIVAVQAIGAVSVLYNNAGSTTLGSMNSLGLSAGTPYTLTIVKDGLQIYVELNGRQLVCSLTSGQDSALVGRSVKFTSVTSIVGHAYDNIYIGNITKPANKLTVRNASVSGTGFSYHTTNIATEIPETPDLVVISLGHNETSTPSQFVLDYQTFVAAVRTQASAAQLPIVAEIQNARTDASATAHANRMAALKSACPSNHWDRIDAFAAFTNYAGGLAALIQGDGIHPNTTGSILWEQTDQARFGF